MFARKDRLQVQSGLIVCTQKTGEVWMPSCKLLLRVILCNGPISLKKWGHCSGQVRGKSEVPESWCISRNAKGAGKAREKKKHFRGEPPLPKTGALVSDRKKVVQLVDFPYKKWKKNRVRESWRAGQGKIALFHRRAVHAPRCCDVEIQRLRRVLRLRSFEDTGSCRFEHSPWSCDFAWAQPLSPLQGPTLAPICRSVVFSCGACGGSLLLP